MKLWVYIWTVAENKLYQHEGKDVQKAEKAKKRAEIYQYLGSIPAALCKSVPAGLTSIGVL